MVRRYHQYVIWVSSPETFYSVMLLMEVVTTEVQTFYVDNIIQLVKGYCYFV